MVKCFEADRGEITSTRMTLRGGEKYLVSMVDNGNTVIITHDDTSGNGYDYGHHQGVIDGVWLGVNISFICFAIYFLIKGLKSYKKVHP
jgi:hypothetical protein